MASRDHDQERTEAPTPRRREEARQEGRVPRSAELSTAVMLTGAGLLLHMLGPALGQHLGQQFHAAMAAVGSTPLTAGAAVSLLRAEGARALLLLAAWGGALAVIALAVAVPQGRGVLTLKPLAPELSRLNPITNLRRVLGPQALIELLKAVIKLVLVAALVRLTLAGALDDFLTLADASPLGILVVIWRHVVRLLLTTGLAYLIIAGVDYAWQAWRHEQSLRLSRQELKQEMRQSEGDPLVKQRLRSMGRALARRQMFRQVPTADVVITNPTHLAVALRYDPLVAPAPIVVAMGQRKIAERIKALARAHGVPCIENKPLARALIAKAKVGSRIPPELYLAVAEVLAFVYRRRLARGRALREVTT